jgi:membrane protein DedA with SNARE-associated domain
MRAWIRQRLPTWAQLLLLSRTVWGFILILLGFACENVAAIQSFATSWGLPSWVPIALGLGLGAFARVRDAYSGANPP